MQDERRTKRDLIAELNKLRQRCARLERFQLQPRDISERERETAVKEAQAAFLNDVFNTISDGIVVTDGTGAITRVNRAMVRLLGYSEKEIIGRHPKDFVPADYQPEKHLYDHMQTGRINDYISCWQKKNGTTILIETNITFIKDSDGEITSAVAAVRDVTLREKNLLSLEENEERFKAIAESMTDGVFTTDFDGNIVYINHAALDMYGYKRDQLEGASFVQLVPHIKSDEYMNARDQYFEKGRLKEFQRHIESYGRRRDGSLFPVEISVSSWTIRGETFFSAIVRDITERKKTADEIKDGRDFLENLLTTLPDGMVVSDAEGKIIRTNSAITRMLGYSEDELLGKTGPDFIPEGYALTPLLDVLFSNGYVKNYESYWQKKDGTVFPIEMNISLLKDHEGRSTGSVAVIRDITDKKATEKRIQDAKGYLEKIYQTLSDGILITDDAGNIREVNTAFENMLGYKSDELVAKHISELYPFRKRDDEYRFHISDWIDMLFSEGTASGLEMLWLKKDGSLCHIEANASLLLNDNGDMYGTVSCIRDITRRKEIESEKEALEMRLRQVQKMEAIGTLAGGIAHDFNNILSAVMGYTELTLDDVPEGSRPYKTLQEVLYAAQRARDLVDQILAFSRQTEHDNKPINLIPIIKETVRFLKATLPATVKIITDFNVDFDRVYSDPTKIHQVIMNLATNAAYAMRENGGDLRVTLQEAYIGEDQINKYDGILPGRFLILSVVDTGVGIMPEVMSRIFNPFFTTKPPGEGSGMGLSVVHGIVKSCKGDIRFESKLGKGSIFSVYLPQVSDLPDKHHQQIEHGAPGGSERILLVDDEVAVANMFNEMLGRLGYSVTVVNSSTEALSIFKHTPEVFDLVITDYTMPDMTGIRLAEKVNELRGDIPVILCTGFSDNLSNALNGKAGICAVLKKPVTKSVLARRVRQFLD